MGYPACEAKRVAQYLGSIGTAYTSLALGELLVMFVLLLGNGLLPAVSRGIVTIGMRKA